MTDFAPTEEQLAIIEFAQASDQNLIIDALAGAAKTSSLVLIAKALRREMILCLAFNKRIAVEMNERLPGNCESMTLNSLGHRAWGGVLGRRLIVDTKKTYAIVRDLIERLPKSRQEEAWEEFADTMKAVNQGKAAGYVPDGCYPEARRLHGDDSFFAGLEREPSALQEEFIAKATRISIEQGFQGRIDFSDQLLLPTIFAAQFPQFPIVMVDETQDLSLLNHSLLRKLAKGRLIAVGDPCQAIYGFRGAHEDSMERLRHSFDMHQMSLTMSFRCPSAVVAEAQWRAPAMRWPEWAKKGTVSTWRSWHAEDVPESAAILCRNNAPLFSIAVSLLKNGRAPKIIGNDFTKGIVKKMKKLGETNMPTQDLFTAIETWRTKELLKSRNPGLVEDQAECFRIFASHGETLGAAIAYAEHILAVSGPIQLMTVHKSKGLEFDDVILLDKDLIHLGEGQEDNLLYVAQTRAMDRLIYAESDNFQDGERS